MKAVLGAGLSELHGKLGNYCGKVLGRVQQLTRLSSPYSVSRGVRSLDQLAQLQKYGEMVGSWRALGPVGQAPFETAGALHNLSGFNWYLHIGAPVTPPWGVNWTEISINPEWPAFNRAVSLGGENVLLIALYSNAYSISHDAGITWGEPGEIIGEHEFMSAFSPEPGVVLLGGDTDPHIVRSDDSGLTWAGVFSSEEFIEIDQFAQLANGTLAAISYFTGTIVWSVDLGVSWEIASSPPGISGYASICSPDGLVFVVSNNENSLLFSSSDGGDTWSEFYDFGEESNVVMLLTDGAGLLVGWDFRLGLVWRSADAGASWSAVPIYPSINPPWWLLQGPGGRLLIGAVYFSDFLISDDRGTTWSLVLPPVPPASVGPACMTEAGVVILPIDTQGAIWRSQ